MLLSLSGRVLKPGLLFLALTISLSGCGKTEAPSIKTFANPEEAGNVLVAAAKAGDEPAIVDIFGPGSKEILLSGDAVEDKNAAGAFVSRYGVMHRWRKLPDGSQILIVGADNFPFPIPLKQNAKGQWSFDIAAGKDELLDRRVGRNELAIIDVCLAAANAQAEYFAQSHDGAKKQYAVKFISDPGKQNGLYWPSNSGEPQSPLGPLVAFASAEGYTAKPDAHTPFHGYYFHMLEGQSDKAPGGAKSYITNGKMTGGFAFVAYPAQYGNSGVMTFIIDKDGVLLQKDLGNATTQTATAMTTFDPDPSWTIVQP